MTHRPTDAADDSEALLDLAERVRQSVGDFVRAARAEAETPRTARSETLGLLDRDGAMSTAALAKRRNVKHQSMRLVVAQLKDEGLVVKTADPHDRRSQVVALTDEGRAALRVDRHRRAEWIARRLRDCSSVEERRTLDAALAILDRIAASTPSRLSAPLPDRCDGSKR